MKITRSDFKHFLNLPLEFFKNFFKFKGDISRADYWLTIVWIVLSLIVTNLIARVTSYFGVDSLATLPSVLLLLITVPLISLNCRRYNNAGLGSISCILYSIGMFITNMSIALYSFVALMKLNNGTLTTLDMVLYLTIVLLLIICGVMGLVPLVSKENKFKTNKYGIILSLLILIMVACCFVITINA